MNTVIAGFDVVVKENEFFVVEDNRLNKVYLAISCLALAMLGKDKVDCPILHLAGKQFREEACTQSFAYYFLTPEVFGELTEEQKEAIEIVDLWEVDVDL